MGEEVESRWKLSPNLWSWNDAHARECGFQWDNESRQFLHPCPAQHGPARPSTAWVAESPSQRSWSSCRAGLRLFSQLDE